MLLFSCNEIYLVWTVTCQKFRLSESKQKELELFVLAQSRRPLPYMDEKVILSQNNARK